MNLLEHYLVKEIAVEDVTEEYCNELYLLALEKYFKVTWLVDCCGIKEVVTHIWREATYKHFKEQGYYLG